MNVIVEYLDLWSTLQNVILNDQPDRTVWRWTPDGLYTAKSAYAMLHAGSAEFRGHGLIWKTWAPLEVKVFLWLAFRKRHWTADWRARHGLEARQECYLCDQAPETIDHIIAVCPFSREIWFHVLQALQRTLPASSQTVLAWWRSLRSMFTKDWRTGMDSLFALVSWQMWKERNARCFREATATVSELLQIIKSEAHQQTG